MGETFYYHCQEHDKRLRRCCLKAVKVRVKVPDEKKKDKKRVRW